MICKWKRYLACFLLAGTLSVGGVSAFSISSQETVMASTLEDDVSGGNSNTDDSGQSNSDSGMSEDDQEVANWIKKQRGMTGDQLETASTTLSPSLNLVGYVIGGALCLIFVGMFGITALDLLYITIPPIRNVLYKAGTDGTGAYTGGGPAGGFGGGYGNGYGGGRFGGVGGASGGSMKPTQWISDEAVQCAAMLGGSNQAQMQGQFGMQGGNQQPMPMKSVIGTYFKKRLFFMILLVITAIILTSSIMLDVGVNLAAWVMKIITMINGHIPV